MDTDRQYVQKNWGMITLNVSVIIAFGLAAVVVILMGDAWAMILLPALISFVGIRNLITRPFKVELIEESGSVRGTYYTLLGNATLAYFEAGSGTFSLAQQHKRGKGLFFVRTDERAQAVLPKHSKAVQSWLESHGHVVQSLQGIYLAAELNNTDLPFERKLVKI